MFDCTIETEMQGKAIELLCKCADLAEAKGLKVPDNCLVDFSLNSIRTSGSAGHNGKGLFNIALHGKALEFYKHEFYDTIVHEFVHILQFVNYPGDRAHGHNFHYLMGVMGIADSTRCHTYDLVKVTGKKRRKQRRWEYTCKCGTTFKIATVTHNRMQKGQIRVCKSCKGPLSWTGKEIK